MLRTFSTGDCGITPFKTCEIFRQPFSVSGKTAARTVPETEIPPYADAQQDTGNQSRCHIGRSQQYSFVSFFRFFPWEKTFRTEIRHPLFNITVIHILSNENAIVLTIFHKYLLKKQPDAAVRRQSYCQPDGKQRETQMITGKAVLSVSFFVPVVFFTVAPFEYSIKHPDIRLSAVPS